MSNAAVYALTVPLGAVGTTHEVVSPEFTDFSVNLPLFLSCFLDVTRPSGTATGNLRFTMQWFDASGAAIAGSYFQDVAIAGAVSSVLERMTFTPPLGAAKGNCKITFTSSVTPTQHSIAVTKLRLGKTELFATNGATWGGNLLNTPANLSSLTGVEAIKNNAITVNGSGQITRDGTNLISTAVVNNGLVSINNAGQLFGAGGGQVSLTGLGAGDLATWNRANLGIGVNNVVNSQFDRGMLGFVSTNGTTQYGVTVDCRVNAVNTSYSGVRNVLQYHLPLSTALGTSSYTDTAWTSGSWDWVGIGSGMPLAQRQLNQKMFGIPCKAGDRIFSRCLLARHRCSIEFYMLIFDKDMNLVEASSTFGGRSNGGLNGDPVNFDEVTQTHIVGTNASTGPANSFSLMWRLWGTNETDPYMFVTEVSAGVLPPGQTAIPTYAPGPQDSVLTQVGSGIQIGDQRNLVPVAAANTGYRFTGSIDYSATPTSATITAHSGTVLMGDSAANLSLGDMSCIVSGAAGTTPTYNLYIINPQFQSGTFQLYATTNSNDVLSANSRMWIGTVTVGFPASGTSTGNGGTGGGSGTKYASDTPIP